MNTKEFREALKVAKSNKDLSNISIDHLFGYGLKNFQSTSTSIDAVAAVMRWQALAMDGSWDEGEVNLIRLVGRKKFIISDII